MNTPSTPATRLARPASPPPGVDVGATLTVVPDLHDQRPSLASATDLAAGRATVLGDIREGLRHDEVGRSLDRGRQPFAWREAADHRRLDRPTAGDRFDRRDQTTVEQDRRRDPAHQLADLGQRLARLLLALADERLRGGRIGVDPLAREAEIDRQPDQSLLGAVVQVPLDPAQLGRLDRRARPIDSARSVSTSRRSSRLSDWCTADRPRPGDAAP